MNLNTEPIKNWFGFTRRERRSTFSLLIIIVVILIVRYSIPNNKSTVEDLTVTIIGPQDQTVGNDSTGPIGTKTSKVYPIKTFGRKSKTYTATNTSYQFANNQIKKAVDINLSDTAELIRLPGIGSVLSARIVKYRTYLGGFARIEQLKEVYGLSAETYDMIKTHVTADSSFITRININDADYKGLSRVRYFDKYEITAILKYRQLKGHISKLSDLIDNKLITNEKAKKVSPYIRFE
jgi:DNA uptake protein ComE-like DNA-binding protein